MRLASILAVWVCLAGLATAGGWKATPSPWVRGAARWGVVAFSWEQFPDRVAEDGGELMMLAPMAQWEHLPQAHMDAMLTELKGLRLGHNKASKMELPLACARMNAAGLQADAVLSGLPALTGRMQMVVVPRGQTAADVLLDLGCVPEGDAAAFKKLERKAP